MSFWRYFEIFFFPILELNQLTRERNKIHNNSSCQLHLYQFSPKEKASIDSPPPPDVRKQCVWRPSPLPVSDNNKECDQCLAFLLDIERCIYKYLYSGKMKESEQGINFASTNFIARNWRIAHEYQEQEKKYIFNNRCTENNFTGYQFMRGSKNREVFYIN